MASPASVTKNILTALRRIEQKIDRALMLLGDTANVAAASSETRKPDTDTEHTATGDDGLRQDDAN